LSESTPPSTSLAPLRNRDFRLLFLGSAVGQTMMPLQFLTQIFWVQENAPEHIWLLLVSLIGASRGMGGLTFGLYGGALADRFDRRKLLLVSQTLLMSITLLIAILMYFDDASPAGLTIFFLLTFLSAGLFSVDAPTRMAIMPDILGPEHTAAGMSLNQTAIMMAMPVAILMTGFVIDGLGFAGAYLVSALGHICVLASLALISYRKTTRIRPSKTHGFTQAIIDVRIGLRYARRHPLILWTILLMFTLMGIGFPATSNLGPTWITTVIGVEIRYMGVVSATWGVGALIASVLLTRYASFERRGMLIVAGAMIFAGSFVLYATGHSVWNVVVANFGLGIAMTMSSLSAAILVQDRVPNRVRGRIMSLFQMNMGFGQLMTLPAAALGQWLGLEVVFPVMAGLMSLIVIAIVVTQPGIWQARIMPHHLRLRGGHQASQGTSLP
jgi:MFS family permease